MRTIVWYRGKDLRIADHVPLCDASRDGEVIPLFVLDPCDFEPSKAQERPHRMQFLLESLTSLAKNLESVGSELILVRGKSVDVLPELAQKWRADVVVAHRAVEPFARERDRRIALALGDRFRLYEGETLFPPGQLRTGAGRPYAVFTPFCRAFRRAAYIGKPILAPKKLPKRPSDVRFRRVKLPSCSDLGITKNVHLVRGGERAARQRLRTFVKNAGASYAEHRDRMDLAGTSRLSQDLRFGTLSARQVWTAVEDALGSTEATRTFQNELIWREFSHSTLWDRPELLKKPFREDFIGFPWRKNARLWKAWVQGQTGYPVVDAASRQLLREGFVHNRARMISASFVTKHLLIPYRLGEAHYMKYLTDGDWAQNNAGWQWSAGCGCDAQPYFRIFNPVTQGKKFDPDGRYVRRWVPELGELPKRYIHAPWQAPSGVLLDAGVCLKKNYPAPVVDHKEARERFLALASVHLKNRGCR